MPKVRKNIVTQRLSGLLGDQIIFRNDKTGRTLRGNEADFQW